MKKLFTIFSLTVLLTLVQSNSANALTEVATAKCNKKCQEEKKANKATCNLYNKTTKNYSAFVQDRNSNRITRQFHRDNVLNLSETLSNKINSKTRDDLEVYVREYGYWMNFYAINVLPENLSNQSNALKEMTARSKRIVEICCPSCKNAKPANFLRTAQ
jgi:hypothetical protein